MLFPVRHKLPYNWQYKIVNAKIRQKLKTKINVTKNKTKHQWDGPVGGALVTKPDLLSSISGIHIVGRENWLVSCLLTFTWPLPLDRCKIKMIQTKTDSQAREMARQGKAGSLTQVQSLGSVPGIHVKSWIWGCVAVVPALWQIGWKLLGSWSGEDIIAAEARATLPVWLFHDQ